MTEYIPREVAISFPFANGQYDREHADEHFINGCESYREWLEQIPAADVVEIQHGQWELGGMFGDIGRCSNCHYMFPADTAMSEFHFCPNGGADMRPEPPKGET